MSARFDPGERLKEAKSRGLGQEIPIPLHERVEALCDCVYDAGFERPAKVKMIAALLLGATTDSTELDRLLREYDRACVRDALVDASLAEGNVVEFPTRRSGPRPRSAR
jgi:hypothetical protein